MANQHGDFIWYELMTTDAEAAQDFYRKVLAWTFQDSGQKDMDYWTFSGTSGGVGGFLQLTEGMKTMGAQPCWMGYIQVDDVDAATKSLKRAGGTIHREPWDIPEAGRVAFVSDPQGVMFYVMGAPSEGGSGMTGNAFAATEPLVGHCAWNELATTAPSEAVEFYADQFGWKQEGDMDMGPMGKYQFLHHGPGMFGAVMTKPAEMPVPAWTYYFRVPDIDEAVSAIETSGGRITLQPTEIPGGEFQLKAMDPQGAHFALVGKRAT